MNASTKLCSPRQWACLTAAICALIAAPTLAVALPATRPVHPALDQLNGECVALYRQLQQSIPRVQMPPPQWVAQAAKENPFARYKLNDKVRQTLEQQQIFRQGSPGGQNGQIPATQPVGNNGSNSNDLNNSRSNSGNSNLSNGSGYAGNGVLIGQSEPQPAQKQQSDNAKDSGNSASNSNYVQTRSEGYTIIVPPANADAQQALQIDNRGGLNNNVRAPQAFTPNNIGLVLDDNGYILVPTFIEREAVGDQPIKLAFGETSLDATFVGSDQQTSLTVLRLANRPVKKELPAPPVKLTANRLTEGSLVVMLSPADGAARLTVWNGGSKDAGVVVTLDGQIAGIARFGQFLTAPACQLIADQIIRHGAVRRATLGVIISQVEYADPIRQQVPDLADKPAMRVDQVMKGSLAEKAGLRQGDLILAIAGEPVHDIPSLSAGIAARTGPTELRVMREGKVVALQVELVQH